MGLVLEFVGQFNVVFGFHVIGFRIQVYRNSKLLGLGLRDSGPG